MKIIRNMKFSRSSATTIKQAALIPEVSQTLLAWVKARAGVNAPGVLIGGLALSFYAPPRSTTDVDLLFLSAEQIPETVVGFKRTRRGAFEEKVHQVEVEVCTPDSIKVPANIVKSVLDTAIVHEHLKVASAEGLIVLKLFASDAARREFGDLGDIVRILEHNTVDLSDWKLSDAHSLKFKDCLSRSTKV